jgi:DNA polymerase-3 subunit gamma/tau
VADTSGRALYLVWRPRRFDDVVGQPHVVRTIRNAVRNGTIAHAYLFSGPRGTGKTTMARLLFKAVNCLQPNDGAPCEQCAICTSANEGRALDLIEMDAASNRGIDDVRELRDKINYSPAEARYRVYILDEAHQLTQAAWDALLKTLEEPPPHAILVLATTESHKVPATVISRCQRFDFHRHTAANIRDRLATIAEDEGIQVEGAVLSWLARAARGGMRDAISLLDQLRTFCGDQIDADSAREVLGLAGLVAVRPFLEAIQEERPGDALEELTDALDRGTDLRVYLADTLTYLRALMLLRYGAVGPLRAELPDDELAWLEEAATGWDAGRLRQLVSGFGEALAKLRDPAQLLVQVELVVLGGWDAPDAGARPPTARREAPERPAAPAFTPARSARPAPTSRSAPPTTSAANSDGPVAGATATGAMATSPMAAGAMAAGAMNRAPTGGSDVGAQVIAPAPQASAPAPTAPMSPVPTPSTPVGRAPGRPGPEPPPFEDEPWPEPDDYVPVYDDAPFEAPPERTAARTVPPQPAVAAASAAPAPVAPPPSTPAPSPASAAPDGESSEPPRSKWDGMGIGGGTVRAHWETDEDDGKETVRVVVEAPPPPPPPSVRRPTNGHAPAAASAAPAAAPAEAEGPQFELADLKRRWPALRDELWSNPIDRATMSSCELVGVEGPRLVIQMNSGTLRLLKDEKKRTIRGELIRMLGKGTDVRFIDDKTPYVPPAPPAGAGSAPAATVAAAPALPTTDPVIQKGLMLFGGPLERLPDDD